MNVRSSWRIGNAAIDREARLDRSGRHELQSARGSGAAGEGMPLLRSPQSRDNGRKGAVMPRVIRGRGDSR